ncbi:MAG: membrane protein insertion efficiency factor YidD [Candidatus Latescibacterota bacterium]|nr:membrane protein insertion efficiency factor YidD [Candidatus Latescibacterota bacterium]
MKSFLLVLVRTYQLVLSPHLPRACRYHPTCSEYAAEAIHRYGALGGLRRAVGRLLRCRPFGAYGYDPVD